MIGNPNERNAPIAWWQGSYVIKADDESMVMLSLKPWHFHNAVRQSDALLKRLTRRGA